MLYNDEVYGILAGRIIETEAEMKVNENNGNNENGDGNENDENDTAEDEPENRENGVLIQSHTRKISDNIIESGDEDEDVGGHPDDIIERDKDNSIQVVENGRGDESRNVGMIIV